MSEDTPLIKASSQSMDGGENLAQIGTTRVKKYFSELFHHRGPEMSIQKLRKLTLESSISNTFMTETLRRAKIKLRGVVCIKKLKRELYIKGKIPIFLASKLMAKNISKMLYERKQILAPGQTNVLEKQKCILWPNSPFLQFWNLLMLFLLIYVFIGTPYIIAFEEVELFSALFFVELLVDLIFFADICITLNTAYYEEDKLVQSRPRIFLNYLTGLLVIDVVSIFPFYLFYSSENSESNSLIRMFRILKITKVIRGSRIMKIFKSMLNSDRFEKMLIRLKKYNGISRLVGCLFVMLLMAHFTGCIWFLSAKLDDFSPETWVTRHGILDEDIATLYLSSLYWAFTILTTVGFGDITARTNIEMVICILWMVFGIIIYTVLIGTITSVLTSLDSKNTKIAEKLSRLEQLGEEVQFSRVVIKNMKKDALRNKEISKMDNFTKLEALSYLSKDFRKHICMMMNGNAADNITFFKDKEAHFINTIVPRLKHSLVPEVKCLYSSGDYAEEIFFIVKGRANLLTDLEQIVFSSVLAGSYFGDYELIHKIPRQFSVAVECNTVILIMNQQLYNIMKLQFTKITDEFEKISEQRNNRYMNSKVLFEEIIRNINSKGQNLSKSPILKKIIEDKEILNSDSYLETLENKLSELRGLVSDLETDF